MKKIIKVADDITSLNGRVPNILARLTRYSLAATSCGIIDVGILIFLVEVFNIFYLIAAVFSFIAAQTLAYFVNKKWIFRDTKTHIIKGYYYFVLINIITFFISMGLFVYGVEKLDIYYIYVRILVGIFGGLLNFAAHYSITFKIKKIKWIGKNQSKLEKLPHKLKNLQNQL